jgi:hypothetical protein
MKSIKGVVAVLVMAIGACGGQASDGSDSSEKSDTVRINKDPVAGLSTDLRQGLTGYDQRIVLLEQDPDVLENVSSGVLAAPDAFGNTWVRTWYQVRNVPGRWFVADVFFFPQNGYEAFYSVMNDQSELVMYFRESVHNPSAPSDPYADGSNMTKLAAFGFNQAQIESVVGARSAFWHNQQFLEVSASTYLFNEFAATAEEKRKACHSVCTAAAVAAAFAAGIAAAAGCEIVAGMIGGPPGAGAAAKACGSLGALTGAGTAALVSSKCHANCDKIQ